MLPGDGPVRERRALESSAELVKLQTEEDPENVDYVGNRSTFSGNGFAYLISAIRLARLGGHTHSPVLADHAHVSILPVFFTTLTSLRPYSISCIVRACIFCFDTRRN